MKGGFLPPFFIYFFISIHYHYYEYLYKNIIMKKFIELIKKYKVYILAALLIVFFFKSCSKSSNIKKLERTNVELQSKVDSYESKIDSFPEILRKEKLSIYLSLDDTISRVDRGPQLMGLHKMIKDSVKSLQD